MDKDEKEYKEIFEIITKYFYNKYVLPHSYIDEFVNEDLSEFLKNLDEDINFIEYKWIS